MTIQEITDGLKNLLLDNHYNPATIKFYEREWKKIQSFLLTEYGDEGFDMERGLTYLEKQYGFQTRYNDGTLSQQRVQLLRVVHMLEDYRLHQVLTRRYYASKNPIRLNPYYAGIHTGYCNALSSSGLSKSTIGHYTSISMVFMDYLSQKGVRSASAVCLDTCNGYLRTLAGYSLKTVEQNVCTIRHFLRYLQETGMISTNLASEIHMQAVSRKSSDIKNLRFGNFDWSNKKLSIIQHKTHKPLSLPIPDAVGWAVIDYIKNGRPKYYDTDVVFVKHMPPFDPLSDNDHLENRIIYHMHKAGIRRDKNRHSGFHSLRHCAGSMLLEMETPLPVITSIMGHSDTDVTGIYLKTDLKKLSECVLAPPVNAYG